MASASTSRTACRRPTAIQPPTAGSSTTPAGSPSPASRARCRGLRSGACGSGENGVIHGGACSSHRSDPTVAFPFSVAAPPALTPPAPLSPRERGEKDQRELLFYSLLSLGVCEFFGVCPPKPSLP